MSTPAQPMGGAISWMVNNAVAANLLMIILLCGGAFTAWTMQKEVDPPYELHTVEVWVQYPGAAPEEVEQGIVLPLEEAVRGVWGIKEVTSSSNEGSGWLLLELVPGVDRMKVLQDVDQATNPPWEPATAQHCADDDKNSLRYRPSFVHCTSSLSTSVREK